MATENSKLKPMKNLKVNMRLSEELKPVVDYLMLLPGGLTRWTEEQLKKVKVDKDLFEKLKKMM